MRWPWVRRSVYDATVSDLTQQVRRLAHALEVADQACARLERKLSEQQQTIRKAARSKSRITQAIRDQARMPDGSIDRRLVGYFRSRANQLRTEGFDDDEIVSALGQWQTTESAHSLTPDRMAALSHSDTDLT